MPAEIMNNATPRYDLDALTALLVQAIVNQPPDERSAWLLLLLERLDAAVQQRDGQQVATDLLHPVIRYSYDRWSTGRWE